MKKELLHLLPPGILKIIMNLKKDGFNWTGDYSTFEEALANSTGYEADDIIDRTIERGINAIQQKEIAIVSDIQLIASVFMCISHVRKETINIIDFGGGTGGQYNLIRQFIPNYVKLNYTVCETPAIVKKATTLFTNDELSFIDDLNKYMNIKPDIIYSSGTLQCVPEPATILEAFMNLKPRFIVINRFPTISGNKDRLTVQNNPEKIYKGSYPSWFFSRTKWEEIIENNKYYEPFIKWNPHSDYIFLDGKKIYNSGYVLRRLG